MFANTSLHVMSQHHDTNTHLYGTSQGHDVMLTLIAILCNSLCSNFGFLKTGLVEYIGALQTPIKRPVAHKKSCPALCNIKYYDAGNFLISFEGLKVRNVESKFAMQCKFL